MHGDNTHQFAQLSRRKFVAGLGAGIGAAGFTSTARAQDTVTIGFALNETDNAWKQVFQRTGQIYAEEALGVEIISTGASLDATRQIDQVRNMLNQGIDALLLNPASSEALIGVTEQATSQDVPVYTADVTSPTNAVNLFTGFGSVRGGRRAGETLIEAVRERGGSRLYEMVGDPAVQTITQRSTGFQQVVEETDDMEIVGRGPGSFSREEAVTQMEAFLQRDAEIDGVFSTWGGGALAAVTVLRRNDMLRTREEDGHIPIVPIDGFPDVLENIREGFVDAALQQPMPFYAPISMEYMMMHLETGEYQGPASGDTVVAAGAETTATTTKGEGESGAVQSLEIQDLEVNGVRPFTEPYWSPATVVSRESDGTELFPWLQPRALTITPDNVDAEYLWGNFAEEIL
jgi:ribose transport system substrate-binding protein